MNILCEKFRPQELSDVIMDDSLRKRIEEMLASPQEKLPHLLFYGSAGTGKSTVARIIAKKLGANTLILNSSDERGIQTVREKIKNFAQVADDKLRIVLLEEIDGMTADAQQSLRNLMETYSRGCRFIGTANFKHKIIEPLHSRMVGIEFKQSDKEKILRRLVHICQEEGIQFEGDALRQIVDKEYPDIRKTINSLQLSVKEGKITKDSLVQHINLLNQLWELRGDLTKMRQLLVDNSMDYNEIYKDFFERIYNSTQPDAVKNRQLLVIAERMYRNNFVADQEINFIACMIDMQKDFQMSFKLR